jgi:mannose-6-phosphate isomerase-like protein (cupin superfamily)
MSFAPLFFLRGRSPTRTKIAGQNPVKLSDTAQRSFQLGFYHHETAGVRAFFNRQAFPAHDSERHSEGTVWHPPPHYHLLQDEHFTIVSGGGTWHLWNKSVHLTKGDVIVVPARAWHWFESDPSVEEPLEISVKYDAGYESMEERFFRNTFGYMADCREQGISPSVFQLMVFFMHNLMPPGIKSPGPEWLNLLFNTVFMYVVGSIGQLLLGYRESYPEYYGGDEKEN